MFLNYIKITFRNLYKEKMYAVINIFGLSLGIACCIIFGLVLHSELTYDRHHLKHKRIVRISTEYDSNSRKTTYQLSSRVLSPLLAKDYPEIESYVRFAYQGRPLFRYKGENFYSKSRVLLADDTVFDIFTHDIIYGDPRTALVNPNSMVISESFAKKVFGDINPVGEIIETDSETNIVTLVFADLPENTYLKYDVLLSINRLHDDESKFRDLLLIPFNYTFLLMRDGYNVDSFPDKMAAIYSRYVGEGNGVRGWIEPLADIRLYSKVPRENSDERRLRLYAISAVVIFILFVACINYINLATARYMKRGREVGIRKVLGSTRMQLISQFLGESLFFALIALGIGLVFVEAAIAFTPISDLLEKQELLNFYEKPLLFLWMLGLSLVVGLIAGIYPAFYLSSTSIMNTLTGKIRSGKKGFRMRQVLILIQFIISMAVITTTTLMALQMRYVDNKPLGFNKKNKVSIRMYGSELMGKYPIFKAELLKNSRVLNVSRARTGPTGAMSTSFYIEDNDGNMGEPQYLNYKDIKEDFIKTMRIELIRGRDFSSELPALSGNFAVVNESLVKKMGWDEPIGKTVECGEGKFKVIGVVRDFHFSSLAQQIEPLAMLNVRDYLADESGVLSTRTAGFLVAHISDRDISGTLEYIEYVFKKIYPDNPFEYGFLEDELDNQYRGHTRLMKLLGVFSGICILISCLGLFGLAAINTEQRTKEIGVRKVLGSSTIQIIVMLSRGILLIVLAASIIASLIAYFIIDEWVTNFAYHAGINPLVFVLSAAIAIAVAFGTVALQAFKTANENPVKALRYE